MVYDAAGNITNDGLGHTYTYDAEHRLLTVAGPRALHHYNPRSLKWVGTMERRAGPPFLSHLSHKGCRVPLTCPHSSRTESYDTFALARQPGSG